MAETVPWKGTGFSAGRGPGAPPSVLSGKSLLLSRKGDGELGAVTESAWAQKTAPGGSGAAPTLVSRSL